MVHYMNNDDMTQIALFRYLYFVMCPLTIQLDGSFADEILKYIHDLGTILKRSQ